MKKLFVLFLLAALVPFTVGCGLFGDNDDTTPVNLTRLSASASLPVSARGAMIGPRDFRNVVMIINGVTLRVARESDTPDGNGNYAVDFISDPVSLEVFEAATTGVVPVIIRTFSTTIFNAPIDLSAVNSPTQQLIAIDFAANPSNPSVSIGGSETSTPVSAISEYATITNIVNTNVATSTPVFTVTFSKAIPEGTPTPIVKAHNVKNSTLASVASADFSYTFNDARTIMTITVVPDKAGVLKSGETYEIIVEKIMVANGNDNFTITSKSHTFKVTY